MVQISIPLLILMYIIEGMGSVLAAFAIAHLPTASTRFQRFVSYVGIGYLAGLITLFIVQTQALFHLLFH